MKQWQYLKRFRLIRLDVFVWQLRKHQLGLLEMEARHHSEELDRTLRQLIPEGEDSDLGRLLDEVQLAHQESAETFNRLFDQLP